MTSAPANNAEWSKIRDVSRQIKAADKRRVDGERAVNATPETLRNLQGDAVLRLQQKGLLTLEQWRAGAEICRVFTALTAGLLPRVADMSRVPGRSLTDDWPPGLAKACRDNYQPWRSNAALTMVAHRTTLADLVFMVVVDNYTPYQVAQRLGKDPRTVLGLLRDSLWNYAYRAGWLSDHVGLASEAAELVAAE